MLKIKTIRVLFAGSGTFVKIQNTKFTTFVLKYTYSYIRNTGIH